MLVNTQFPDKVSLACGNKDGTTYCGARIITFYDQSIPISNWLYKGFKWDLLANLIFDPSDPNAASSLITVTIALAI